MEQSWFYQLNNQQFGPVSRSQIVDMLAGGVLTVDSYVWIDGMAEWERIGQIPELTSATPADFVKERPTSVTVFAVLNIVFGGLGLLCTPISIASVFIPQPDNPLLTPPLKIYTVIGGIAGLVFAAVLLASGIGLLNLRKWARQTAYVYGWAALAWGILGIVINAILYSTTLGNVPDEAVPAVVGGIVGGMCGGLVGLIYPVFLVVYMRKPYIIQACSK